MSDSTTPTEIETSFKIEFTTIEPI